MGMVNTMRRTGRRRFIENYEFPIPLIAKLTAELRDRRKADIALDGLRGWYLACLYADGRMLGMPSKAVDQAWHEMILMTREYMWFCRRAFGGYLHHSPDSTLQVAMDELLERTLETVDDHGLPLRLFTADDESDFEDGEYWTAADLQRMRDRIADAKLRRRRHRSASSSHGAWGFSADGGGGGDGGSCGGGGGCGGGGCGGGG